LSNGLHGGFIRTVRRGREKEGREEGGEEDGGGEKGEEGGRKERAKGRLLSDNELASVLSTGLHGGFIRTVLSGRREGRESKGKGREDRAGVKLTVSVNFKIES
jgi:hypothetical protein